MTWIRVKLILPTVTILLYILLCLIWGSTWMAIKIGLATAPPMYSLSFRFGISIIILYAITLIRGYSLPRNISDWWHLGKPGLFMYGGSYALIYLAEHYINSSLTSVLFASFPLFVALLSYWLLRSERLKLSAWLGLALGLAGIVIISYDSLSTSENLFYGSLLALLGSFVAAYGTILHKRNFSKQNIVVVATVQMSVGWVPMIILALLFEKWSHFQWTPETVWSILYLAIFGTVITFLGYYWMLSRMRVVVVSLITFVIPIVAIIIGVVGFDETLSTMVSIGSIMILASILLVVKK